MARGNVLVSLAEWGDYTRLAETIALDDSRTVLEGQTPGAADDRVDLWILDWTALEDHYEEVESFKSAGEPLYRPVLLLCPEGKTEHLRSAVWGLVDDVVSVPTDAATLEARIENLLRTRRLSREVADARRRFESLVRTTPNGIVFVGKNGEISFANDSFGELLGYEADALLGEPITSVLPAAFCREIDAASDPERADGDGPGGSLELSATHADGHDVPLRLSYSSFELDDERYLTGIADDITDIRKRETRLQVLNRVLRHDIRNEMNLIDGHAELLADRVGADPHLETITSVVEDVLRLSDQVRELDALFDATRESRRRFDLRELVAEARETFDTAYPEATVETDLPGEEVAVEALPLIESAVHNVVENAIEHNDTREPEVTIAVTARSGERVDVEVRDNGPGLPPGDVRVIETDTETGLEHASGLGLWLINWIVSESGGRVEFAENEPCGSVVTVSLPRAGPDT